MDINKKIYIKKGDGTNFYDVYIKEISVTNNVMSDWFASCSFTYKDNSLCDKFDSSLYIDYRGNRYFLFEQPNITQNYTDKGGFVTYELKFSHVSEELKQIPFTDEPITAAEENYKTGSRSVIFFGRITEMVDRINAALQANAPSRVGESNWSIQLQTGFVDETEPSQFTFSNEFVFDALSKMYEIFKVPYNVVGKTIYVGVPVTEVGYIFEYGSGVGLKNNDRVSKKNQIITRIAATGGTQNIPVGYPKFTGIERHIYTRQELMPTVWVNSVQNRLAGSTNPIIDYYDAIGVDYPNNINPYLPSIGIYKYEDIYPTIKGATYGANNIDTIKSVPITNNYDDTFDAETGEYKYPYFEVKLYPMGFDLYAQAALTGEMTLSMMSGDCKGANFPFAVDEEAFNKSFYVDGVFTPNSPNRDYTKFPNSTDTAVTFKFFKEDQSFGRLYPNPYQIPKAGDTFVILNIEMPQFYITQAQTRLDERMIDEMKKANVHQYEYPLDFSPSFLHKNESILAQITTNSLIKFKYNGETLSLPIQSITIKEGSTPLPQYEIKLTDEIAIVKNAVKSNESNLKDLESVVEINSIKEGRRASAFYRGLKRVEENLFDADGTNRIDIVEALALKANIALIGQDSSNFSLQGGGVKFTNKDIVTLNGGSLYHYVVSRSTSGGNPVLDGVKNLWVIPPAYITGLDVDKDYYVYIQANRINNSAIWIVSQNKYIYNEDPNVFYFLWGQAVIYENIRAGFSTFGLTATLGGFIVTQQLKSPNFVNDGTSFAGMLVDLINSKIIMGDDAEIIAKKLTIRTPTGSDIDSYNYMLSTDVSLGGAKHTNEIINSRTDVIDGWSTTGGTATIITDSQYGSVVQWERTSGTGNFQKTFNVKNRTLLANKNLVYYVIAKKISAGEFYFGGWSDTWNKLSSSSPKKDLGNGWFLYHTTFLSGSSIGTGDFGISTVTGTWQFYGVGIYEGTIAPNFWSPSEEDLATKQELLATGISIGDKTITVTANNFVVQSNLGVQTLAITADGKIKGSIIEATTIKAEDIDASKIKTENLITTNLNVTSGAKIGGFKINGSEIINDTTNALAALRLQNSDSTRKVIFGVDSTLPSTSGISCVALIQNNTNNSGLPTIGLSVGVNSGTQAQDCAIHLSSGFISNFAAKPKVVSGGSYLITDESAIACDSTSNTIVSLPADSNLWYGKIVFIRRASSGLVTVNSARPIYINSLTPVYTVTLGGYATGLFMYIGGAWHYNALYQ